MHPLTDENLLEKALKVLAALLLVVGCQAAWAAAEPQPSASEAAVRELLEVTQARKLMDGMMARMDSHMQEMMKAGLGRATPTPEQQAVMDEMRQKMVALFREEVKWEVLEPQLIEVYRKAFTEQEVQGMLEFYKSPAGQAVTLKMPLVMQHSMSMMQKMTVSVMPKIQQIEMEAREKLKEARK